MTFKASHFGKHAKSRRISWFDVVFSTYSKSSPFLSYSHSSVSIVAGLSIKVQTQTRTCRQARRFRSRLDWQRCRRPSSPLAGMPSCFWRRFENPLLSSPGRWSGAGPPAEPLRLRHHVGEFVLFFHLAPPLSFLLRVLRCFPPSAEIDTSSVGFGCAEKK